MFLIPTRSPLSKQPPGSVSHLELWLPPAQAASHRFCFHSVPNNHTYPRPIQQSTEVQWDHSRKALRGGHMHRGPRNHQMKWARHSAFGRNAHIGHVSHLGGKQCWGHSKNDRQPQPRWPLGQREPTTPSEGSISLSSWWLKAENRNGRSTRPDLLFFKRKKSQALHVKSPSIFSIFSQFYWDKIFISSFS